MSTLVIPDDSSAPPVVIVWMSRLLLMTVSLARLAARHNFHGVDSVSGGLENNGSGPMLKRFAVLDSDSLRLAQRSTTDPKITKPEQSDCLIPLSNADHTPDLT